MRNYALAETLRSGQAFRWREAVDGWEGVVGSRWVRLVPHSEGIWAFAADSDAARDWSWLEDYLQTTVDLDSVVATFPSDPHIAAAVQECQGLRLLRQEPWECLASFILSSTKQIVQIQQIVQMLCERYGDALPVLPKVDPAFSFPSADRLASLGEADLRCCKMGFRAPYLRETARMVSCGEINLEEVRSLDVDSARAVLTRFPGVGRKIADCVLLFAYGFPRAFPVDVWILKALRQLYFPRRRPTSKRLLRFTETYFGPNAGYAQQYLFHYMRTRPIPYEPIPA